MTITALLTLLMVLIIVGIIIWAAKAVLPSIPMEPLFRTLAVAVLAIICVVIVFYYVIFPLLHAVPT